MDDINMPSIRALKMRVTKMKKIPQVEQKSQEWYDIRKNKITASAVGSCLYKNKELCEKYVKIYNISKFKYSDKDFLNPYETKDEYLIKKCDEYFNPGYQYESNENTLWGNKYENVSCLLYKYLKKTDLLEFGILNHPKFEHLAASPDGITPCGVMVEIKCPKKRKIVDNYIPIYYFAQVQLQLEVCNLMECDYLEAEIKEVELEDILQNKFCGYITHDNIYHFFENSDELKIHLETVNSENILNFYYINNYQIINIKRDQMWFNNANKYLLDTWNQMQSFYKDKSLFDDFKEKHYLAKNKKHQDFFDASECLIP